MLTGYLDPGAGSIIASAVVGGAAAIGVVARSARSRIAGVFRRNRTDADPTDAPEAEAQTQPAGTEAADA